MRSVNLVFKKLGEHWYPDLNHDNPSDLILDPRIERFIEHLDIMKAWLILYIFLNKLDLFLKKD